MRFSTMVCFGDSLTAFGTWPTVLQDTFHTTVINAGVGGNTALQGLARFDTDVVPHSPELVFIGFGTNDQVIYDPAVGSQVSPDAYRRTLEELIDRSEALGAKVCLLTPCVVDSDAYYSRHPKEWCEPYGGVQTMLESYRNIMREVAAEKRVHLLDIGALSSGCKDAMLGTPAHPDFDGVHPIDTGKALYAQWVCETVENM